MTLSALHRRGSEVTRNGADRLAAKLAEEQAERELMAALHTAIHSTCLSDHSAAQSVADTFRIDIGTVYRWCRLELVCRPLQDFLDLVNACIRGKGEENPAGRELVRYVRRLYLDPQAAPREVTPSFINCTAAETMGAVGGLLKSLLDAVSPDSPGGTAPTPEEWAELEPQFEAVAELLEALRLARPTCMRRVPIADGGMPS